MEERSLASVLLISLAMRLRTVFLSFWIPLLFQGSNALASCQSPVRAPLPALRFYEHFTRYFRETPHDREMKKIVEAVDKSPLLSELRDIDVRPYIHQFFSNPDTARQLGKSRRFRKAYLKRMEQDYRIRDSSSRLVFYRPESTLDPLYSIAGASRNHLHPELKKAISSQISLFYEDPNLLNHLSEKFLNLQLSKDEKEAFFKEQLNRSQEGIVKRKSRQDMHLIIENETNAHPVVYQMKSPSVRYNSRSVQVIEQLYHRHVMAAGNEKIRKEMVAYQNKRLAKSMLVEPLKPYFLLDSQGAAKIQADRTYTRVQSMLGKKWVAKWVEFKPILSLLSRFASYGVDKDAKLGPT